MNLYLDDDTVDRKLIALLRKDGHGVVIPADVGFTGAADTRHFIHACRNSLVLLSRNHDDFLDLHELVRETGGEHPGVLIIRSDNDPTRDMTTRAIARALDRLQNSGVPLQNEFYVLNHWR